MDIIDTLEQDRIWRMAGGMPIKLEEMTPSHRQNTLNHLRGSVRTLWAQYVWRNAVRNNISPNELNSSPEDWFESRPLIVRLKSLIAEDEAGPVVDGEVVMREIR